MIALKQHRSKRCKCIDRAILETQRLRKRKPDRPKRIGPAGRLSGSDQISGFQAAGISR
jgi:hypothetical protein